MGDGFDVYTDSLRDAAGHFHKLREDLQEARKAVLTAAQYDHPFDGGSDLFTEIDEYWQTALHYLARALEDNIENVDLDEGALLVVADRYDENEEETARAVERTL